MTQQTKRPNLLPYLLVLLVLVGVKPAGVVAQTLVGDLVRAKVPHELEVAQKRVEDGRAVGVFQVFYRILFYADSLIIAFSQA